MQYTQSHKTWMFFLILSCCFLTGTSFANPFSVHKEQRLKKLVEEATKGRVIYIDHFAGPEEMTGIILKGLNNDSKKIIAWNPPGTDFLMVGRLINSSGEDLTQVAHDFFISEVDHNDDLSFESIEPKLNYFSFSSSPSGKTIHIITDPSCSHCSRLSHEMEDSKEQLSDFDIRIVPIGRPGVGIKAAAKILKHGPNQVTAQSFSLANPGPDDLAAVERNTDLLVGVFPKLATPMILVDGKPIKNTLDALLEEVFE